MTSIADGRYLLDHPLGCGGSALVIAATDTWRDRASIVLKIARTPALATALNREKAVLQGIRHPCIAYLQSSGTLSDTDVTELRAFHYDAACDAGVPYLVIDKVAGSDSLSWAQQQPTPSVHAIANIGVRLAAALAALHANDLWHGDVSPSNVIVGPENGCCTLIDFGLAGAKHFPAQAAAGTPLFMAPEALAGQACAASDVYSLALTLNTLWTGQAPSGHLGQSLKLAQSSPFATLFASMTHAEARKRSSSAEVFTQLLSFLTPDDHEVALALRDLNMQPFSRIDHDDLRPHLRSLLNATSPPYEISGAKGSGKTMALQEMVRLSAEQGAECPGILDVGNERGNQIDLLLNYVPQLPRFTWDATLSPWQVCGVIASHLRAFAEKQTTPWVLLFDNVTEDSPIARIGRIFQRTPAQNLVWIQTSITSQNSSGWTLSPLPIAQGKAWMQRCRPLRILDQSLGATLLEQSQGNTQQAFAWLQQLPGDALAHATLAGDLQRYGVNDASIHRSTAHLSPQARALLQIISHLSAPVHCSELRARFGDQLWPALTELQKNQWVVINNNGQDISIALSDPSYVADWDMLFFETLIIHPQDVEERRAIDVLRFLQAHPVVDTIPWTLRAARYAAAQLQLAQALDLYAQVDTADARLAMAQIHSLLGNHLKSINLFNTCPESEQRQRGIAESLNALGRYEDAALHLAQAPSLSPFGQALYARSLMLAGKLEECTLYIQSCRRQMPVHPEDLRLCNVEAMVHYWHGDAAKALSILQHSLSRAAQAPLDVREALLANCALLLQKTGDYANAEKLYKQSLERAQAAHDLPRQLLRVTNLATLVQDQGELEAACQFYREAYELATLIAGRRELARIALNWANLLNWLGQNAQALTLINQGLDLSRAENMATETAFLDMVHAEALLGTGEVTLAQQSAVRAYAFFSTHHNSVGCADALIVLASIALYQRDNSRCAELCAQALQAAQDASRPRNQFLARLWWSVCLQDTQQLSAAQALAAQMNNAHLTCLADAAAALLHKDSAAISNDALLYVLSKLNAEHSASYLNTWFRRDILKMTKPRDLMPTSTTTLTRVLTLTRSLAQDNDPHRLLDRIIDAAITLSGAERGIILLQNEGELTVHTARHGESLTLASENLDFSRSIAHEAMQQQEPVLTFDAQGDARFSAYRSVHAMHVRSVLCLPLISPTGVLGALYLDHRHQANAFAPTAVAILSAFADQAAIALRNARLISELDARRRDLEQSRIQIESLNQQLQIELQAREQELAWARAHNETVAKQGERFGMVGSSPALCEIYRIIERVASKDVSVTILGESGTGKELVARAIHQASSNKTAPFVSINCGAIAPDLIESELFGHEKGAFTGAVRQKPGLFEVAGNGTVFLDEIGDMPLPMQVKLLRVLQQQEFRRVGGTHTLTSQARVISAANRDLAAMVRRGSFREDLWYRLNIVEIQLPPLRERREDLPALIDHFLRRYGGPTPPKITRDALAVLLDYSWPGNIRELENELRRALALADHVIAKNDLSPRVVAATSHSENSTLAADHSLRARINLYERETLSTMLKQHNGRVASAARELGLTRAGLYKKLHKHRLLENNS